MTTSHKQIKIGIACGKGSEEYVNFLLDTINATESKTFDLHFIFGKSDEDVNIDIIENKNLYSYETVESYGNAFGSLSHGKCLDKIFEKMDSEIGMFLDCDVAFLSKNWDIKMMDSLKGKCVIVGSEYLGGHYAEFPNVIGCMFLVEPVKKCGVSFLSSDFINVDKDNSKVFKRDIGEKILLDVGWQLPYKLITNGYSGLAMPYGRSVDSNGSAFSKVKPKFIKRDMRGEEYQLNGEPIFTHIGGSRNREFSTNSIILEWSSAVKEWLNLGDICR